MSARTTKSLIFFCLILALMQPHGCIISKVKSGAKKTHQWFEKHYKSVKSKTYEALIKMADSKKFICTGGKNPKYMLKHSYLEAFEKGPCSPTVFVPGIMGSLMIAEINCKELRSKRPQLFKDCGWKRCFGWGFGKPSSEYKAWIPKLSGPMSLVDLTNIRANRCFTGIFGLTPTEKNGKVEMNPPPGVRISTVGSSPKTSTYDKEGRCGFTAVEELLPLPINFSGFHYFRYLRKAFKHRGYVRGLTMQALPYDFRVDFRENKLKTKFKNAVDRLHEVTGKKVNIIAHSFGNYQTVNYLWNTPQAEKDQKVARYFALAPPFIGAAKIALSMLGMDPSFSKKILFSELGMTPYSFKNAFAYYQGVFNLMPHDAFEPNKNEPWMKAVQARIQAEKEGKDMPKGTVMDMFPSVNAVCNDGFEEREQGKCHTFLDYWVEYGQILDKKVTAKNMPEMLKEFGYSVWSPKIYGQSRDDRFIKWPTLGVQTNIIYGAATSTMKKFYYDKNPKELTSKDKMLLTSKVDEVMGDGSVTATSAILPGIKWADDFNNKVKGAKPVNLIEICSAYQRRETVFEGNTKQVTKNAYYGIDCECKGTPDKKKEGRDCAEHNTMLEDVQVIKFLLDSCTDGQPGKTGERFKKMSRYSLSNYVKKCKMFNEP